MKPRTFVCLCANHCNPAPFFHPCSLAQGHGGHPEPKSSSLKCHMETNHLSHVESFKMHCGSKTVKLERSHRHTRRRWGTQKYKNTGSQCKTSILLLTRKTSSSLLGWASDTISTPKKWRRGRPPSRLCASDFSVALLGLLQGLAASWQHPSMGRRWRSPSSAPGSCFNPSRLAPDLKWHKQQQITRERQQLGGGRSHTSRRRLGWTNSSSAVWGHPTQTWRCVSHGPVQAGLVGCRRQYSALWKNTKPGLRVLQLFGGVGGWWWTNPN